MNAEQKRAWLGASTGIICLVGFLALLPFFGPFVATGAFGLFGINGFAGLIGRGEHMDERDRAISRRATLAGAFISYATFRLGCMGTWAYIYAWQRHSEVSIHVLPIITFWGGVLMYFGRSVAILVLYGRRTEADHA